MGTHNILVVGAGAIGGVTAGGLVAAGHDVTVLSTNPEIARAVRQRGIFVRGASEFETPPPRVIESPDEIAGTFDTVILATQPPQVEEAARSIASRLATAGRVVCLQNGLCEQRVARVVGEDRVLGAVVAWGASMVEPGVYDRTSLGGFTVGRLSGPPDDRADAIARALDAVGPAATTDNLLGARFSKLAINCAISTLGTIGGDRLGALMRRRDVRRLVLEIMTEVVAVARPEGVRLQKVAGTLDLDWVALTPELRTVGGSFGLALRHAVLVAVGLKYRRLRSSMLAAIERGRTPAVDFLNGEVVDLGRKHAVPTPVNAAARDAVWNIARGAAAPGLEQIRRLYDGTRAIPSG